MSDINPYYADERKYLRRTKNPITEIKEDKKADQFVHITGTIFGITIRPGRRWSPFCEKLFRQFKANGIRLDDVRSVPGGTLSFINDLTGCKRLSIEDGKAVDLSPLRGNPRLEDLRLYPSAQFREFDLTSLPNLLRCQVPLCPELSSVRNCTQLISVYLGGGCFDGSLNLSSLSSLEEFICVNVSKLKATELHPKVRLRSLELSHLREFTSVEPVKAITEELRIAELNKVPAMKIEWLRQAEKLECISLRLGTIPSIKFLNGLRHLQVLDLFGSKVTDGDLSLRDSLKGELDSKLWGQHNVSD